MIMSLFRKDPNEEPARALYGSVVRQSREPVFYTEFGVVDDVDGRFELVVLHTYLLMERLKNSDVNKNLPQTVFDVMFRNMDDSLREMGVGDLSVGKKIRAMAEAFYGRATVYGEALKLEGSHGAIEQALGDALQRNVFQGLAKPSQCDALAQYVRAVEASLRIQPESRLGNGIVVFPEPKELLVTSQSPEKQAGNELGT